MSLFKKRERKLSYIQNQNTLVKSLLEKKSDQSDTSDDDLHRSEFKKLKSTKNQKLLFDPKKYCGFGWLISIFKQTDEETLRLCGYEVMMYLTYLKFSCLQFFMQFLVGISLIVVYVKCSYHPSRTTHFSSFLRRITIQSYVEVEYLPDMHGYFWLIFVQYAISVSLSQMQIQIFKQKMQEYKQKQEENSKIKNGIVHELKHAKSSKKIPLVEINHRTVMLTGIDKNQHKSEVKLFIYEILRHFRGNLSQEKKDMNTSLLCCAENQGQFVVSVESDYRAYERIFEQIKLNEQKRNLIHDIVGDTNDVDLLNKIEKSSLNCEHHLHNQELILREDTVCSNRQVKLMKLLKESISTNSSNSGFAFIYFDKIEMKMQFMKQFKEIKQVNIDVLNKQKAIMGCKHW